MRTGNIPGDPSRPVPGSEKWFVGHRTGEGARVLVWDGSRHRPLRPMLNLLRKSPTGFEWGYGGSGPAQLAFAMLYAVTQDEEVANEFYQEFKYRVIARLEKRAWTMSETEVIEALQRLRLERIDDKNTFLFQGMKEE